MIEEELLDERTLRFLYETLPGRVLAGGLLCRRPVSALVGWWYGDLSRSRERIPEFVERLGIRVEDFEDRHWASFNEFFARQYRPGLRPFDPSPDVLPAFAEGRALGFDNHEPETTFPVKGEDLRADRLLGKDRWTSTFAGGPVVIMRLAPQDYHRFHFAGDGTILDSYRLPGRYHSVNPVALKNVDGIFCTNERHVVIQDTQTLGHLAYIDVGAMIVGRIEQTHGTGPGVVGTRVRRGEDKGCFKFGASTTILLGEAGRWRLDPEIRRWTQDGTETLVTLGSVLGHRL